jgi:hypothetical protein
MEIYFIVLCFYAATYSMLFSSLSVHSPAAEMQHISILRLIVVQKYIPRATILALIDCA